jgi:3-oxoacyl-[acyl-carrier-protein] synthase-1
VGLGARTALGEGAAPTMAAVRAGVAGFEEHPCAVDKDGNRMIVAMASFLAPEAVGSRRFADLAVPAAKEALSALEGKAPPNLPAVPAFVGLPPERPGRPVSLEKDLADSFQGVTGPVEFLSSGHAAGLWALEKAAGAIQGRRAEFCLVGGVDSYFDADALEWVDAQDQLHSETNSWGYVPGEAACFCLLTSGSVAARYRLPVLAEVVSVGTGREENRIKTDAVCLGKGLTEAFRRTLGALAPEARVDQVICDLNGEAYRADEYGFTVARTGARFVDPSEYLAPADCWGDVGAASGPLFVALAAAAAAKGFAPGPRTLVWASSEGGERGAALLEAEVTPCP